MNLYFLVIFDFVESDMFHSLFNRFKKFTSDIVSYQQNEYQLGEILAKIALEKLERGIDVDWRKLKPLYIQPPPVFGR